MPTRDEAPLGAPCWLDLFTSDPEKSRVFYGDLFGWTSSDPNPEFGGYVNFSKDGLLVAGLMGNDGSAGTPDGWSVYLTTDNAEKMVEAAEANGSQVIVPAMPVGDLGVMAVFTDAGGAVIGAWQPGEHKGFGVWAEPGTAGWFELHTRDHAKTVAFYRDVFGWDTYAVSDSDEFRYTTLGEGDDQLAGIMDASAFLRDGVAAHWSIYFQVDDTDVTLARITELGGGIVTPAEDTPYGRLATATDVTGAQFKLVAQ